jgi:hypothetical protein
MSHHYDRSDEATRLWQADDGVHIDVRGLDPPQPIVRLLELIDTRQVGSVIAQFSYDPAVLYPEFDARGWYYEIITSDGDDAECEDVTLRLVRFA